MITTTDVHVAAAELGELADAVCARIGTSTEVLEEVNARLRGMVDDLLEIHDQLDEAAPDLEDEVVLTGN